MAKAANGICLLFSSFAWSVAVASSATCSTSEELLGECGGSLTSAVLLQVDRGERLLAHADEEHGRSSDPHKQWTITDDDHAEPVTMKELLRQAEPLQDQIDDIQSDVKELRSDLHRHSGRTKRDDEDEGGKKERNSEGSGDKKNNNEEWAKDYIHNNDEESNSELHSKPASDKDAGASDDWAWRNQESKTLKTWGSGSDKDTKHDQPDWGGIAPRAWNGLEDVNAKDHGPDASWKGDGVGVASGKKYSGEHPYEKLMDVDYVIDSNPEPTRRRKNPEPTRRRTNSTPLRRRTNAEPNGDASRRRTPAKTSPTQGGKSPSSSPKAPSKSPTKSGKAPSSSKKAPSSESKTAPKGSSKSSASGSKTGPKGERKSQAADKEALLELALLRSQARSS